MGGRTRGRRDRVYTNEDLEVFNLLEHPVWVFDVEEKAMRWSNTSGLELWNAECLESLLSRNFADMSETTVYRLQDYMTKFRRGESVTEQWTYYPRNRGPTTVSVTMSGIRIEGGRLAMLNEGILPSTKEESDREALRCVEMLRHLPVSVCQFDMDGNVMTENPEDLRLFGVQQSPDSHDVPIDKTAASTSEVQEADPPPSLSCSCTGMDAEADSKNTGQHKQEAEQQESSFSNNSNNNSSTTSPPRQSSSSSSLSSSTSSNSLVSRFVDVPLAQKCLSDLQQGTKDLCVEAQQRTNVGLRWFSISMRRSTDPLDNKPSILYSARDITEVIVAKKQADQANLEKSEFLAVMAHELRTPLHHIVGSVELLGHSKLSASQADYVYMMQNSTLSLMAVINDLLDYTKLEAGKMSLEVIPFDLKGVLAGCKAIAEPKAQEKGLSLQCSMPTEDIPVDLIGDPNRLRQILLNLLTNATKFTNQGSIHLSVTKVDPQDRQDRVRLRFDVVDTGIGIPPEQQGHIFLKYRQADASIARNYGGTGLGLAICKCLVQLMGGCISLESTVGEGTTFRFEIPFDLPPAKPSGLEASNKDWFIEDSEEVRSLHVLVVDDNSINQRVIKAMLEKLGHIVALADNGDTALEQVEQSQQGFDLIFMDVQMPVMDGIEATKRLRTKGWHRGKLPIVGLTASYQPSDWEYYQEIGMNDCIAKPVRLKTLQKVICDVSDKSYLDEQQGSSTGLSLTGELTSHPSSGSLSSSTYGDDSSKDDDYRGGGISDADQHQDEKQSLPDQGQMPPTCIPMSDTATRWGCYYARS